MILLSLAVVCLLLAMVPAVLLLGNLRLFRRLPLPPAQTAWPQLSVLIPARNEEHGIIACVQSALASRDVHLEVIVLDDQSTDATADRVRELARCDNRVRLETAPPLPPGWCGKQHACHTLASLAQHDWMAFLDADVRLAPVALARAVAFARDRGAPLVSGFPHQETGTILERLLIPLIHFVLLGFLPIGRMRRSTHPAYGAGCGQLFLAHRPEYEAAGGHQSIKASLHDGLTLPRSFRRAGFFTDVFDATDAAACRMYRSAAQAWHGLAKNATEGMAAPAAIVPWTLVLGLGQVAPVALLASAVFDPAMAYRWPVAVLAGSAFALGWLVRLVAAMRFRQSLLGAALHPIGVLLLLAIQWYALGRRLFGRPPEWKGRRYAARPGRAASATAAPP